MDEIYNDYAAKKMGIDHTGQVSLWIRTILLWVDTDKVYFLLVTSSWFGYNSVSTLVIACIPRTEQLLADLWKTTCCGTISLYLIICSSVC